ncbi:hypothetical protein ACHAXS_002017 [Conticribra weissflogii]
MMRAFFHNYHATFSLLLHLHLQWSNLPRCCHGYVAVSPSSFSSSLLLPRTTSSNTSLRAGKITITSRDHRHRDDDDDDDDDIRRIDDERRIDEASFSRKRRTAIQSLVATAIATAASSASSSMTSPAAATTFDGTMATAAATAREMTWPLGKVAFSLLPLAGSYTPRVTVMETIFDPSSSSSSVGDGESRRRRNNNERRIKNHGNAATTAKYAKTKEGQGIWTFDQVQGVVNVNVPVRMTVIKLSPAAGGGLWILNPLAPTPQLVRHIRSLELQHGPVRHIVLGTVALEHKATLGPFAQYFPRATVWIQPGQWSFPLPLPVEYLGVVQRNDRLRVLPSSRFLHGEISTEEEAASIPERRYAYWAKKRPVPEWTVDVDYETLGPLTFRSVGAFSETAFFHKPTKTLLVTDAVCSVTQTPPKVIREDPRALLYHARDSIEDVVEDTPATRNKGWRRMVQFGLVFFPSQIDVVPVGKAIRDARRIDPSMAQLGDGAVPGGALYPWTWRGDDADLADFDAISQNGTLFCPPILTKLILDREPEKTLEWVGRIADRFDFDHVIPGHLNNYVEAGPKEFSEAFDPLRSDPEAGTVFPQRALAEDLALLQEASDLLTKYGVVAESRVCDLEPARRVGRFAAVASKK